jgi:uncharacterized protein (DUF111 family)
MKFDHTNEHLDEEMVIIQANIDDMNPEWSPYVTDKLLELGANDVYWIPIIMKKGRPGLMLNVLLHSNLLEKAESVIFRETTTLGLRYMRAACHRLGRGFEKVTTPWGDINVKTGYHRGELVQFAPEYTDCEQAAKAHNVPLQAVYEAARRQFGNDQEK